MEIPSGFFIALSLFILGEWDMVVISFLRTLLSDSEEEIECEIRKDSELRKNLTEKQIDKMIADSFPASDPPSTY